MLLATDINSSCAFLFLFLKSHNCFNKTVSFSLKSSSSIVLSSILSSLSAFFVRVIWYNILKTSADLIKCSVNNLHISSKDFSASKVLSRTSKKFFTLYPFSFLQRTLVCAVDADKKMFELT